MDDDAQATGPGRPWLARLAAPLARPAYRLLWTGQTVSAAGDALVQLAMVFAILRIGGTASDIGYVAAIGTVTRVAFILAGGVWADRLRRQYVMLASDVLRAAVQGVLAVLLLTGHARVWEIALGSALYGAAQSFFGPAAAGLVPETVPKKELQGANALLSVSSSFFEVGGPAVAGVLVAAFGPGLVFAIDAGSFVVSAVSLGLLSLPPRPLPKRGSFVADLATGWHELAVRPWYWLNLFAHALGNFAIPAFLVLGPVIAERRLGGASAWGVISAGFAAGAVGGGLLALRWRPRRPLVTGNLALTVGALMMLALIRPQPAWQIAVAAALDGIGMMFLNATWATTMQALIPDQVRSRVDSYDWLGSLVIMPAGFAVAGPLAAAIGNAATLWGAAVLISVPCALVVLLPGIRAVHKDASGQIVGPPPRDHATPPGPRSPAR
jgi:MFS family permease